MGSLMVLTCNATLLTWVVRSFIVVILTRRAVTSQPQLRTGL